MDFDIKDSSLSSQMTQDKGAMKGQGWSPRDTRWYL